MYGEAAAVHEQNLRKNRHLYGPVAVERLLPGFLLSAADYVHAMRQRSELVRELAGAMRDVDVILVAGAASAAPRLDSISPSYLLTGSTLSANAPFSLTGYPALIVCSGFNPGGLPLPVQVVAKPFEEASAYRAGSVIEKRLGTRSRRPDLSSMSASNPANEEN